LSGLQKGSKFIPKFLHEIEPDLSIDADFGL